MKAIVSGASGLVGSALLASWTAKGHDVTRLGRSPSPGIKLVSWDPAKGVLKAADIEGFDVVVHLAGENIASGRWNAARKARIRDSRVDGTRLLVRQLATLERRPSALVCASAIGYYGNRGNAVLDETASPGEGFLPDVCRAWEEAALEAEAAGIRVCCLRIGIVLSRHGGALAKMLLPFKLGVGGIVGPGTQYMSWITLADLVAVIDYASTHASLRGPINAVAPNPVTNAEFTKALGRALHRPTIFPMPAFAARLAFGEMADALLLASTRVVPTRLLQEGFTFQHDTIDVGLAAALEKR